MLSGSAIVRVSALLVAAGLLAALAQFLWPRGADDPAADAPTVTAAPRENPVAPAQPSPAPEPVAPVVRAPPDGPASQIGQTPKADQAPQANQAPQAVRTPPEMPPPSVREPAAAAPDPAVPGAASTDPRAVALVDLNTATLAQLNGLKGGGNIGRAIIQKRPYASVDQLLAKRVLSRAAYERIKDQVVVQ